MYSSFKKHISIIVLFTLLFSNNIKVFADDLTEVKNRVNNLQALDPTLPNITDQKGMVGTILSLIFDTNGKIKNTFIAALGVINPDTVPRWDGTQFISGSIQDDGVEITVPGQANIGLLCDENGSNCTDLSSIVALGSYWSKLVNDIFYTGGNVSIGTNVSNELLTISGSLSISGNPDSGDDVGNRDYNDSRYLGQGSLASDADLLDGQDGTYYLDDTTLSEVEVDAFVANNGYMDETAGDIRYINVGAAVSDSQLLDGIDSTGFLRKDVAASKANKLTLNSDTYNDHLTFTRLGHQWDLTPSTDGSIDLLHTTGSGFHRLDVPGLQSTNDIFVGGNTVYHDGNSPYDTESEIDGAVSNNGYLASGFSGDQIADNTVDSSEIEDNSIGAADLAADSVGTSEIINDTIVEADISDAFVARNSSLLNGQSGSYYLDDTTLSEAEVDVFVANNGYIDETAGDIRYINVGATVSDSDLLDGIDSTGFIQTGAAIPGDTITDGTIDSSEIEDNTLTASDLAADSVGASELQASYEDGSAYDSRFVNSLGDTMSGELTIDTLNDSKLTLKVPAGDTTDWNYINFVGKDGTRDGFIGTDSTGMPLLSTDGGSSLGMTTNFQRISTPSGTLDIGAMNTGYAHFQTDRDKFYMNKKLVVDSGDISGYTGQDFTLQTSEIDRLTILNSNGNVGIGITTPSEKLSVNGGLSISQDPNSDDDVGDRLYNDGRYINVGEAIGGDLITDGTIDSSEIEDNTLTASDLAVNSVGNSELNNTENLFINNIYRSGHTTGHIVGSYNSVGPNGSMTNPIYSVGSSYLPSDSVLNNHFGIGYSHGSASFTPAGAGWGMYVSAGGVSRIYLDADNGIIYENGTQLTDKYLGKTAQASDSSLLDGLDSTQFIRSDADAQFTGNLTTGADNYITFGPNTGWSSYLRIGGNGRTVSGTNYASIATTNGNLHLDAGDTRDMYLNFYEGGSVNFGNGASGVTAVMGSDGDLWKGGLDNTGSQYWHAGNDGAGSTLDADTIDGIDSTGFLKTNYLSERTTLNGQSVDDTGVGVYYLSASASDLPSGVVDSSLLSMSFSNQRSTQLTGDWRTNNWYVRNQNNTAWGAWNMLYHDGNSPYDTEAEIDAAIANNGYLTSASADASYINVGESGDSIADNTIDSTEIEDNTIVEADISDSFVARDSSKVGGKALGYLDIESENGSLYIGSPGGAKLNSINSIETGALKITLPTTWSDTMMRMTVDVYDYGLDESITLHIGGYNYSGSSTWFNTFAQIISSKSDRDYNVRFGHDGTNNAIYIGETNSTWSYPGVTVRDFQGGHQGLQESRWDDNWSISVVSSLGTITSTESSNYVYSDWNKIKNMPAGFLDGVDAYNATIDSSEIVDDSIVEADISDAFVARDSSLLDSLDSTQFMRVDVGNTMEGNNNFYGTDITGTYSNAPIEVREVNLVEAAQSVEAYAPAITWHWGGRVQGQLSLESDSVFHFRDGGSHSVLKKVNASEYQENGVALSSKYLGVGGTSVDSNLLDGLDSTEFSKTNEIKNLGTVVFDQADGLTASFISKLETLGAFDNYHSIMKATWDYAGNQDITDTGFGSIDLAGSIVETWTDNADDVVRGNIHVRVTRPTTGVGGGAILVYNDQGPTYLPGWRQIFNSTSIIPETNIAQDSFDDSEIEDDSLTASSLAPNSVGDSELIDIPTITELNVLPGDGNGIRFWGSNSYEIAMGDTADYKYGPVTDYSIKMNMDATAGRGWTWGLAGSAPTTALGSINGNFQTIGWMRADSGVQVDGTTVIGGDAYLEGSRLRVDTVPLNSLSDAKTDSSSMFIGTNAGLNDDGTDNKNIGVGSGSLMNNTSGFSNTAYGDSSLQNNTTGGSNTAIGRYALRDNILGSKNTAIGKSSMVSNSTGSFNTAIGSQSLQFNSHGDYNVANGAFALNYNTTGSFNIGIGANSLKYNTTGSYNSANGHNSLYTNTTGNYNVANGYYSLFTNTTGDNNVANGNYSLYLNDTGSHNVANGNYSLSLNTAGNNNTAIGYNSGYQNIIGSNNVFIGYNAGYSETGSNKLYIDNTNTTTPLIYGDFSTNAITINGTLTQTSDRRYKENIETLDSALEKVTSLRGVTYDWKDGDKFQHGNQVGVIAQEVEAIYPEVVVTNEQGYKSVDYSRLVAPLIEAIKEQQHTIEDQDLKLNKQQEQIDALIIQMDSFIK